MGVVDKRDISFWCLRKLYVMLETALQNRGIKTISLCQRCLDETQPKDTLKILNKNQLTYLRTDTREKQRKLQLESWKSQRFPKCPSLFIDW